MSENKIYVLAVDDDEMCCTLYRNVLETAGFEVETVDTPVDAVHSARVRRPDVILTDLVMPGGMDPFEGFRLLLALKVSPDLPDVPVVICSASHEEELQRKGLEWGAAAYVTKPFRAADLAATLRRVVDEGRMGATTRV